MTDPERQGGPPPRPRARKPSGVARMRQPIKDQRTGQWRARYVDLQGAVRQLGLFKTKGKATAETAALVAELNRSGPSAPSAPTLLRFLADWPTLFPRHPRTHATNRERIERYIAPLLPGRGDLALDEIRRADLRAVQDALLRRGLAKTTIDGAFSALSSLMRDAMDIELIDANPAARLRVRAGDPRLNPKRGQVRRRAVPVEEIAALMAALDPAHRAVCWSPLLTGCRPGELFAMHMRTVDADAQMIYVHQTVDRYGRLMDGLKGTHHIVDEDKRGRWTLMPAPLIRLLGQRPGWLFSSPRGKHWAIRNFYRDVWTPAQREAGTAFTLYDLRHTFASRLIAAGIPLVEVAAWMGHSLRAGGQELTTNTTTRVYAHATGEWRQRALELLSELHTATEP